MIPDLSRHAEAHAAITALLESHNDGTPCAPYAAPQIAVVTCMDFRIELRLPRNLAFVLRTGGANPRPVEPYLAFAVARADLRAVALIGHTDCAMAAPDPDVVRGLLTMDDLKLQYRAQVASLAVVDVPSFTVREAARLEGRLGVPVVPLLYDVTDHRITRLVAPARTRPANPRTSAEDASGAPRVSLRPG